MATYHHGDLRRAILEEAALAIVEVGPSGWSMRELARRIGVSHAASNRHFADKRSLLTALAREGWGRLAGRLEEAEARRHALSDVGKAYMRFAAEDAAFFEVVCRPELYDTEDRGIDTDRRRVFDALHRATAHLGEPDPVSAGIAAWALVHGLATLHRQGMLPADVGDPLDAFRMASAFMFR